MVRVMNELAKARKQLKGNKKNITRMSAKEISDITPQKNDFHLKKVSY